MRPLHLFLAIVLAALAVRLAVTGAAGFSRPLEKDEVSYSAIAENLAAGRGFYVDVTRTVGGESVTRRFESLRPPLYPALLAAAYGVAGPSAAVGRVLSCLLRALAAGLLLVWGRRVFPGAPALIAAGLLIVWPAHVWASGRLLSEPLFVLLAVGSAASLERRRHLLGGVLLGLAILTRPGGLVLVVPAALYVVLRGSTWRTRARALLLLLLPALSLPLPWVVRNAALHDRPLLTTNLGVTFLGGNSDLSLSSPWPGRWHLPEEVLADDPPDMGYYGWSHLTEAENDRRFLEAGVAWVREHPDRWLRLVPLKVLRFFDPDQHSRKGDRELKRWAGWLSFGLLLPLLAPGLVLALGRWRETLLVTGLIGAHLVLAMVFYGDARARLPAIPPFLLLGGVGLAWLGRVGARARARRSASRGASRGPRAA
ncbi:MAG: glycosyltransferase family 39 protein [Planctomycetota bacterium]|jgi:4-amino-4-deoxy-L-arabinose transferase-like glycosyltransferase